GQQEAVCFALVDSFIQLPGDCPALLAELLGPQRRQEGLLALRVIGGTPHGLIKPHAVSVRADGLIELAGFTVAKRTVKGYFERGSGIKLHVEDGPAPLPEDTPVKGLVGYRIDRDRKSVV